MRVHSKVAQPGLRCPRKGKARAIAVPEPRFPYAQHRRNAEYCADLCKYSPWILSFVLGLVCSVSRLMIAVHARILSESPMRQVPAIGLHWVPIDV